MVVLLSFPDNAEKRARRARVGGGWSAETVDGYIQLLDILIRDYPRSGTWRRERLGSWCSRAGGLMEEIRRRSVQVRADTQLMERLLKLKGLVSEAEIEGLPLMDLARRENDRLASARDQFLPDLARPGTQADARRAPAALLTPDLVSDNLQLPRAPQAAGGVPDPAGVFAAAGSGIVLHPIKEGTAASEGSAAGDEAKGGRLFVNRLFHVAMLPARAREVREKVRGLFSFLSSSGGRRA